MAPNLAFVLLVLVEKSLNYEELAFKDGIISMLLIRRDTSGQN